MIINKYILLLLLFLGLGLIGSNINASSSISSRLSGRILLQVESAGEAWYVNPINQKRYYLGRPDDAFNIMRSQGIGISNKDISRIVIGVGGLSSAKKSNDDFDGDYLPNSLEDAIGSNKYKFDSDENGYSDLKALEHGRHPANNKKMENDPKLLNKLKGKILLQVESAGEAWYVHPDGVKRYYLGRPDDAFNIMRYFGLGITNNDLSKIEILEDLKDSEPPKYVNDYGYSIILPQNYSAIEGVNQKNGSIIQATSISKETFFTDQPKMLACCEPFYLQIKILDEYVSNLKEWVDQKMIFPDTEYRVLKTEQTTFAGNLAYRVYTTCGIDSPKNIILVNKNFTTYLIKYDSADCNPMYEEIVSTFQFTEKNTATN